MIKRTIYTQSHQLSVFLLLLLLLGFGSCNTDGEKVDNLSIYVRYCRETFKDDFQRYITQIRYLLFDEDGVLQHVSSLQRGVNPDLQHLSPALPYGRYTLIAIGNYDEHTVCDYKVGATRLEELTLAIRLQQPDVLQGDCDPICWGILPFEYTANKANDYICDMSNIHCRLRVTVRWANHLPEYRQGYSLHLYNVPGVYGLSPAYRIKLLSDANADPYDSTLSQIVHSFPETDDTRLLHHGKKVDMYYAELDAEFVTYRYTDDRIPSFRMYHGEEAMMKEIDLTRFFRIQGWQPSRIAEQNFHVLVVIHPQTDKVTVSSFPQSDVAGWLDGGSISVNRQWE